jgi:hypothetical protein
MNKTSDMPSSLGGEPAFRFESKGKTLALLATFVTKATLCDQLIVSLHDWQDRGSEIVANRAGPGNFDRTISGISA